jgi:hypothetical protein
VPLQFVSRISRDLRASLLLGCPILLISFRGWLLVQILISAWCTVVASIRYSCPIELQFLLSVGVVVAQ